MQGRQGGKHSWLPGKPGSMLALLCFCFFLNIFIHLKIIVGKMGLFGIINIMKMCAYILSLLSPH